MISLIFPNHDVEFLRCIVIMSIKIGDGFVDLTNTVTSRERLVLSSATNSNLVQIYGGTGNIQFSLNDFTFGRYGNDFRFRDAANNTFIRFSPTGHTLTGPTQIQGTLSSGVISSTGLVTSNIEIRPDGYPTLFRIQKPSDSNLDLWTIHANGSTFIQGPVGIGTTIPRDYVDINSNLYVARATTSSNMFTNRITSIQSANQSIQFTNNKTILYGNVEAVQQFTVSGAFNFDGNLSVSTLTASDTMTGKRIYLYNTDNSLPTLDMIYNGTTNYPLSSNATLSTIAPKILQLRYGLTEAAQRQIMNIDATGKIGIGTNVPDSTVHIQYSPCNYTSNMFSIHGVQDCQKILIDAHANVGIGTTIPSHNLHIERATDDYMFGPSNAYIGLHQHDLDPILTMVDSTSNTYWLSNIYIVGGTSNVYTDSNMWLIDIASYSNEAASNILFGCNVVPYLLPSYYFPPASPFVACYSNMHQVFTVGHNGSLHIHCSNMDSPYMLNVYGSGHIDELDVYRIVQNPSTSNIDFVASSISNIEKIDARIAAISNIFVQNIECNYMYTSNYEIVGFQCFDASSEFNIMLDKLVFNGTAAIFSNVMMDTHDLQPNIVGYDPVRDGKLKIQANTPAIPTDVSRAINIEGEQSTSIRVFSQNRRPQIELEVAGSTTLQSVTGSLCNVSALMFLNQTSGALSITHNNQTPKFSLSPNGRLALSGGTSIDETGNIGIGLNPGSTASQPLLVRGNTTIQDSLNASVFSVNTTTKTVAINTDVPSSLHTLHVAGPALFTSTSQFNSNVFTYGNVGIGTIPVAQIHAYTTNSGGAPDVVQLRSPTRAIMTVKPSGNVGVGTTNPMFTLHVTGDLNFDGGLFQGGSRYISSQWTTQPNTSNIFILDGNVGIGTTLPRHGLHVHGCNVAFGSNVYVGGTVYASGSFVSTSDQLLKVNLQPISDSLDKIGSLHGYTYDRTDTGKRDTGLIAQEVQRILPEVVSTDDRNLLTIAYGNMAGLFVEGFKELTKQIQELRSEVQLLRNQCASASNI